MLPIDTFWRIEIYKNKKINYRMRKLYIPLFQKQGAIKTFILWMIIKTTLKQSLNFSILNKQIFRLRKKNIILNKFKLNRKLYNHRLLNQNREVKINKIIRQNKPYQDPRQDYNKYRLKNKNHLLLKKHQKMEIKIKNSKLFNRFPLNRILKIKMTPLIIH